MAIQASLKGFGVTDKHFQLTAWDLQTTRVTIEPSKAYSFFIPIESIEFPSNSTLYKLYAHALIVQYKNFKNSEVYYSEPLKAFSHVFLVRSYETNQGVRLAIEQ